ncbi:class I SAM-dependent rRNA methyltransferase [Gimesia sp.]|uniref:class I SAM-dependent rRNA methyltransferase n=1 Tax=Gimesia sp. TaxID=2024833 RepID=UPI000C4625CE|nr:class I SAM-dependent rRNA methyltransferase [Gimesia sp.]MAX40285.1 pseudouridine synthase [Gimesia sp.]|tara:strand:- start:1916 stop:3166 length:1251 start_codon:yes stop_codon:yes gene_type:complete
MSDSHPSVSDDQVATDTRPTPRVVLKPRRALPFFGRHPWVFAGAISRIEGNPNTGDEVILLSDKGEFIAHGLYNPNSNIRVRLYSWAETETLDDSLWTSRLEQAVTLREEVGLLENFETSGCRLVFSESDQLSGLTIDRYGAWFLVQFSSLALSQKQDLIIGFLKARFPAKGIWLRTEKGMREAEGLEISDQLLDGEEPPAHFFLEENGIRYGMSMVTGQKTGFYLDQRENRLAAARYLKNHRTLELHCYTGAFALNAIIHGQAQSVLSYDSSQSAIDQATANAELNGIGNRIRFQTGKAYAVLEQFKAEGEQFDSIILDPPKMARHRSGVKQALKGYFSLNRLAFDVLKPGGILITCSCSGLISQVEFQQMLASVSQHTGRHMQILEQRSQPADHPVSPSCPENQYLKCFICRVL